MAFVLLVRAFLIVFEKLMCACFSQIALETMVKPVPTALLGVKLDRLLSVSNGRFVGKLCDRLRHIYLT